NVQLFTVPSDGGQAVCLTSALDRSCGPLHARPLWSSDGRFITVAAEERGDVGLWRVAATGGSAPARAVGGERAVNGFSTSADGPGYAVVYTNPRGSQGYGGSFAQAVVGDWGGGDYADVMAALDEALARHPFIDPDRLGVLGGSYGGFLTSWTVGHTKRFKAAC